jgi:hypothetical protein
LIASNFSKTYHKLYSGRRDFNGTKINIEHMNKGKRVVAFFYQKKDILLMKWRGYFFNDAIGKRRKNSLRISPSLKVLRTIPNS